MSVLQGDSLGCMGVHIGPTPAEGVGLTDPLLFL